MKFVAAFLLFFSAGFYVAVAQDAAVPVSTSFTALAIDKPVRDIKVMGPDGQALNFNVYTSARGRVVRHNGDGNIVFFREIPSTDPEAAPQREVLAQVKLQPGVRRWLLLFNEIGENRYSVLPIPDDFRSFGAGTYRFMNLTPYEVSIKLADNVLTIQPRKIADLRARRISDGYHDTFIVSVPEDGKPRRVFEGKLYFSTKQRFLYLLLPYDEDRPGSIRFIGIPETVGDSSEEQTAG